ncbi:MAG: tetratricopeptide repeat protein [Treponema sp.]|jgi:tetratricopeptide (TPR) repeat protein|nr:tetratricopeptide repeat protein [Treponema sp.]
MERNNYFALAFRSAAVFIILFQIRLIAADLADTPVFTFTLLAGFSAAVFLSAIKTDGKQVKTAAAVISIALIPWAGRLLVAMPRIFIPDRTDITAITFDSMLLNLDRNNFVSLFPYYWSAVTTFFSVRSRKFLRAAVIADASLLLFIFSVARTDKIEIYRWPVVMIVMFASVVFLQALALLFSTPPETKTRAKEICFAIAAVFLIIAAGGFLFLKPIQEQAVEMGGGLLEPKFFSFDFSKFLKLDPEISVKNDLILIVKKDNDDNILLRRSVLSGYSKKHGFYKIEELDEKTHPQKLPAGHVFLNSPVFKDARESMQEYFLVNVESTAFIGMKEPVEIIPYENWDASSFKAAYAVNSLVSDAKFQELKTSTPNRPSASDLGLSEDEFKTYTEYGNDKNIRSLAEEITDGYASYTDKIIAVYRYLKYGDYRYSLKPGIAPDGDQLGWFLFKSKKGYCSYYAFAMTLLLRSLEIPARVAAGFFVDQETNVFDYYPVRSDMAHAWVEIAFPEYGWIEFDPTTENLAEDEEFRFSAGTDPVLFEKLMREIFENRFNMKAREAADNAASVSGNNSFAQNAYTLLRNNWLTLLIFILIFLSLYIRCGLYLSVFLTRYPRKKSIRLMKHACRLLRLAGLRRKNELSEPEWALKLDNQYNGIYSLYQCAAAARFAPEYSKQELALQLTNYKIFRSSYRAKVPLWRRITTWVFPAAIISSGRLLVIFLLLGIIAGSQPGAQNNEEDLISADALFREASDADFSEHWERAIELYREGSKIFPEDARFSWALGNLYFSRSLYGLAWDEYRKIEPLIPDNTAVLIRLARTAGHLNRYAESVDFYERVIEVEPDNSDAIDSLGWMYFKVHRLADGERLLVCAVERFGDDSDFSMTLGTIYSDLYRYDDSKYWYNKAIAFGESLGNNVYTSIAWYNLSILESRFYHYDLCMDATNSSLRMYNRASGHLARGELLRRQLKLTETQKEYEAAYETDTSPLAKLALAQVYQLSGRLEEARLYAQDCLKDSDNSWMINFGIDPNQYKRDIHLILAKTYSGLLSTERFLPWVTPKEKILSLFRTVSYMLKKEVNLKLYRKYSLAAANAYGEFFSDGGEHIDTHLDSLIQYNNAFYDYPHRAVTYLNKARMFETTLIPAAVPLYDLEEGILFNKKYLIEKAMYKFDAFWEKEFIANCYKESKNAQDLFAMNRGAVNQAGMRLPVQIDLFLEEAVNSKKHLEKALEKAGFKKEPPTARFRLAVQIHGTQEGGYTAICELVDKKGETEDLRYSFPLRETTRAEYYKLARFLRNEIFTVN